jgi:hypothetical protein
VIFKLPNDKPPVVWRTTTGSGRLRRPRPSRRGIEHDNDPQVRTSGSYLIALIAFALDGASVGGAQNATVPAATVSATRPGTQKGNAGKAVDLAISATTTEFSVEHGCDVEFENQPERCGYDV